MPIRFRDTFAEDPAGSKTLQSKHIDGGKRWVDFPVVRETVIVFNQYLLDQCAGAHGAKQCNQPRMKILSSKIAYLTRD